VDTRTGETSAKFEGLCAFDINAHTETRDLAGEGCAIFPTTPFTLYALGFVYSPDGRFVATMEEGPAVWEAATGRLLSAQAFPSGCVMNSPKEDERCSWGIGVLFTPDSSELLFTTNDCTVYALSTDDWAVTRQAEIDESVGDCGRMSLIGFTPDGTLIGMTGWGNSGGAGWLHRIDPETLEVTDTKRAHDGSPKSFALSPSGTLVATGASDGVVRIWDAESLALLHQLNVEDQAQGVAFADEGRLAVTPSGGGMQIFDIVTDSLVARVRAGIVRGFTPEECQRFNFDDRCPTLEELRGSAP
jgi:WD40 repeat protein